MVRRFELTDGQYAAIADLLPPVGRPGGAWRDHRQVLDAIFWVLHTGAQWRELPERYGPWQTAYYRFRRWQSDGTIDAILRRLYLRLDEEGRIDPDTWLVDATIVRAGRAAAGAGGKIGRR